MIDGHNDVREGRGLKPLAYDPVLARMAASHAEDMASHETLSHDGPTGGSFASRARRNGLGTAAENIGVDGRVGDMMDRWLGSSRHASNILSVDFDSIGVGMEAGPDGSRYWCVCFAKLADNKFEASLSV